MPRLAARLIRKIFVAGLSARLCPDFQPDYTQTFSQTFLRLQPDLQPDFAQTFTQTFSRLQPDFNYAQTLSQIMAKLPAKLLCLDLQPEYAQTFNQTLTRFPNRLCRLLSRLCLQFQLNLQPDFQLDLQPDFNLSEKCGDYLQSGRLAASLGGVTKILLKIWPQSGYSLAEVWEKSGQQSGRSLAEVWPQSQQFSDKSGCKSGHSL